MCVHSVSPALILTFNSSPNLHCSLSAACRLLWCQLAALAVKLLIYSIVPAHCCKQLYSNAHSQHSAHCRPAAAWLEVDCLPVEGQGVVNERSACTTAPLTLID